MAAKEKYMSERERKHTKLYSKIRERPQLSLNVVICLREEIFSSFFSPLLLLQRGAQAAPTTSSTTTKTIFNGVVVYICVNVLVRERFNRTRRGKQSTLYVLPGRNYFLMLYVEVIERRNYFCKYACLSPVFSSPSLFHSAFLNSF